MDDLISELIVVLPTVKDSRSQFYRIIFASDVHGSEPTFKKLLNAAKLYKAQAVILGGDVTGKVIVPIVEKSDGQTSAELLGESWTIKGRDELDRLEEKIKILGFYPYHVRQNDLDKMVKSDVDSVFRRLMKERLESWMRIVEERLSESRIRFYMTGGNDDPLEMEDVLRSSEYVIDPENEVVDLFGYEMISLGYSNPTPWKTARELEEDVLAQKIEALASRVKDMSSCIFNLHVPPLESGLDACPKLDTSVYPPKPILQGGSPVYIGAGSSAVRQAIEKYQPLLGLHGHIHESRGEVLIGRTVCINPGSEYGEGMLRAAIINLSTQNRKIASSQFISG